MFDISFILILSWWPFGSKEDIILQLNTISGRRSANQDPIHRVPIQMFWYICHTHSFTVVTWIQRRFSLKVVSRSQRSSANQVSIPRVLMQMFGISFMFIRSWWSLGSQEGFIYDSSVTLDVGPPTKSHFAVSIQMFGLSFILIRSWWSLGCKENFI